MTIHITRSDYVVPPLSFKLLVCLKVFQFFVEVE